MRPFVGISELNSYQDHTVPQLIHKRLTLPKLIELSKSSRLFQLRTSAQLSQRNSSSLNEQAVGERKLP